MAGFGVTQEIAQSGPASNLPSVGRWIVTLIPEGWAFVSDFGIRQMPTRTGAVTANVCLGQDGIDSAEAFAPYIERQKTMIGAHLKGARLAGPQPAKFPGADEACMLAARHTVGAVGNMLHAQTYVRQENWVGIITLTVLESQLKEARPAYDAFLKGLRIGPPVASTAPMPDAAEFQAEGA
jgi:hypothetical protein